MTTRASPPSQRKWRRCWGYKDVKSVYGLIRTGKIRARKVGNTFLVILTSVREFAGEE